MSETIPKWLARIAADRGDEAAIGGPGDKVPLSYRGLQGLAGHVGQVLEDTGIGAGDVVMVSMPSGPLALATILTVVSHAAVLLAPSRASTAEHARLLDETPVSAILTADPIEPSLVELARARDVHLLVARPDRAGPAGKFELRCEVRSAASASGPAQPADTALLVATAGTTSAPKLVALTHASIFASIRCHADWLGLTAQDHSLVVTPFNHLHALLRSAFPFLLCGGTVTCTAGFEIGRVAEWLRDVRPTVLSAVPAMYRLLIKRARETNWQPRCDSLRLLVVGSDSIADEEIHAIEELFGRPVRQFYGLSEAAPLIALSPVDGTDLPAGSVGRIISPWSVITVDANGLPLPQGEEGEIAVIGGTINPVVGQFGQQRRGASGRLLTGDLGRVDADRNLTLAGRVGDRIHRGGEKIVPAAVESVLDRHPQVRQSVVFPIPDPILSQRVGALVVPMEGYRPCIEEIVAFSSAFLAAHEVPEHVVLADAVPLNAVGKIARATLAELLGLGADAATKTTSAGVQKPIGQELEPFIRQLLERRLGLSDIDAEASFADLGGDSLSAVSLLVEIEEVLGIRIPPAIFTRNSSVAALAHLLREDWEKVATDILIPVATDGHYPPLFIAHDADGTTPYAHALAAALGPDQPVYTFQARPLDDRERYDGRMESLATRYVCAMRRIQPEGPYYLAGLSFGGQLALEMAQQLFAQGEFVAFLGIIDDEAELDVRHVDVIMLPTTSESPSAAHRLALVNYVSRPYPGRITLLRATNAYFVLLSEPTYGWSHLALGGVDVIDIPGDHRKAIAGEAIDQWAPNMAAALAKARHLARGHRTEHLAWAQAAVERAREHAATPAIHHTIEARRAVRRGDLAGEAFHFGKAIRSDPAQPAWVHLALARSLTDLGKLDDALQAAKIAARSDAWPLPAYTLWARLLVELDRLPELNELLEAARLLSVRHAGVQLQLAEFFKEARAFTEASAAARLGQELALTEARRASRMAGIAERKAMQLISASGLFDERYYYERRRDVAQALIDPVDHYLDDGAAEGCWPCPLFDTVFYRSQCPDLEGENPLVHFIRVGATLGRKPHSLFDTRFYLSCYGANIPAGMNPLTHFLTAGGVAGLNPHPLFDSAWYMSNHPDVRFDHVNPLVHYLAEGWRKGTAPHREFDGELYLEWNPDVRAADTNPLEHFVRHGQVEGRLQPVRPT